MPVSITDYLDIDKVAFDATGAFDAILDVDSKLFIDPLLLRHSEALELQGSYDRVKGRFADILKLLSQSEKVYDTFWREALRRFTFGEMKGLCIGYSSSGTSGSGMGKALRSRVLRTAKEIVDAGIIDPEFFELLGLFEEGIGADRISDMVGWIILDDLFSYSERIFAEFGVPTVEIKGRERAYQLPRNRFNGYPIILIPCDILRDLPIAENWNSISYVAAENAHLRQKLNRVIGSVWTDTRKRLTKSQMKALFLGHPDVLQEVINAYRDRPAARYDFDNDPADQVIWYRGKEFASDNPLPLHLPTRAGPEDVLQVVRAICQRFKDLVENNQLNTLLYRDDDRKKARREETAQKLFYGIADSYCEANNLDLSRETNGGRGPVDFKISSGYRGRVLVEVKLSTNTKLKHGLEVQIDEYQKAEKTQTSIMLLIDVGGNRERLRELRAYREECEAAGMRMPEIFEIDAQPKLSASHYQRKSRRRYGR